jgi:hypothetical protein
VSSDQHLSGSPGTTAFTKISICKPTDSLPTRSPAPYRSVPTTPPAPIRLQTLPRLLITQTELPRPSPALYRLDPQHLRHSPASSTPLEDTLTQNYQLAVVPSSRPDLPLPLKHHMPEFQPLRSTSWTARAPESNITPHIHSPSTTHIMDHAAAADDQPTEMDMTDETHQDNANPQPTEIAPTQPHTDATAAAHPQPQA